MVNKNKLLSCSSTGSASDVLLARLCDEFTAARRNGQSISVEDVIRQYPEHADQIRTAFDALQLFAKFPQATWKPDAVDELPERIARFDIVRMIGRGGMGVVYEATHPSVSRRVAIKVLKPELLASENFAARFRLEAEAASRLNHPNIVPFIDYGDDNGAAYMSMLYIDGESLDHVLNRFRNDSAADSDSTSFVANDFPRIAQIGASVASALAQAHQQHAIHRDIKPANLILDKAGKIWVTDFGLAKLRDDDTELSCLGDMIGTPRYMAPEQIRGISDERSDIYSLGATLYELATGQKPWDPATTPAGLREQGRLPPVRTINPHVPVGLATIISKACHPSSRHRYKNAAELQFALNQFAHGGTVEDRRRLRGERPAPSRFRDIVLATALVGSLTVAAVLSNTGGKIAEVVSADVAFAADTNEAPQTFVEEPLVIGHAEGSTSLPSLQLTASDPDGSAFSWQLMPSGDHSEFIVQSLSGHLCFRNRPAFAMPADANADNVYELKLQATDLRQPHVAVFTVDQVNGEICICEPTMGIRHKLSIPRQLQAITTTDGQTYLHTHRSNDGTIALYRSEVNESGWQSRLLQADCHLSPFATALAEGTDSTFLSVQQCRDGFELQAMQLDDNYQFSRVGSPIPLETTVNPIGLSCLGDGDYQLLDAYGGNAVLTEMAISDNVIVGCRSLPVGWDFSGSRVLAMAAWTDVSAETSRATRAPEQVVHIRVQPIPPR